MHLRGSMKIFNILILIILSLFFCIKAWSTEVNLYSARKEHLIKPLINLFEKETGIKVNLVTAKAAQLHERKLQSFLQGGGGAGGMLPTWYQGGIVIDRIIFQCMYVDT